MVTAFRIVEREEKTDAMIAGVLSSRKIPVTQLPGRPKKWKEKCMEEMKTSISNRLVCEGGVVGTMRAVKGGRSSGGGVGGR